MKINKLIKLVRDEPVFTSGFLKAGNVDVKDISRQLSRWAREEKIIQLRRGVYILGRDYQNQSIHPFHIANRLQKASYISLQSALSFYSLIPEHVPVITNVSTGRPENLSTPVGDFIFRHIHPSLFYGYRLIDLKDNQVAFIAVPEKALLDLIHLTPGAVEVNFLKELRLQNWEQLDLSILDELARQSRKNKWKKAAALIRKMAVKEEE